MEKIRLFCLVMAMTVLIGCSSEAKSLVNAENVTRIGPIEETVSDDAMRMSSLTSTQLSTADVGNKIEVGNCEFDTFISENLSLSEEDSIERVDCIEKDVCYRVRICKFENGTQSHVGDWFFIKNDTITSFSVYYKTVNEYLELERVPYSNCGYDVVYEDVSFDGIKDIVISLGYDGDVEKTCAYIYEQGGFVYEKSFEQIGSYSVDQEKKLLYDKYNNAYIFENNDFSRLYKDEIEDEMFKEYVDKWVKVCDGEVIEKAEWIAHDVVYRISIKQTKNPNEYGHTRDYFFFNFNAPTCFEVTYPLHDSSPREDRHVESLCDFYAEYRDVTFDGNNDIVIFLGYGGGDCRKNCAYVYKDGEFVYTKSFEKIPNYFVNNDDKCIEGWSWGWEEDGAYDYWYRAKYIDGAFNVECTKTKSEGD